jgi:hypothetical protein
LACDGAEFGLAKSGYISAFGKILPEKAVCIFIAPALPRGLRIAKIDIDIRGYGELLMPRLLTAFAGTLEACPKSHKNDSSSSTGHTKAVF